MAGWGTIEGSASMLQQTQLNHGPVLIRHYGFGLHRICEDGETQALLHASSECEWATDAAETATSPPQLSTYSNAMLAKKYRWICRKWNNTPGRCPGLGCTYEHVCLNCAYDTTISNKSHKVIQCLKRRAQQSRDSIHMHPDYFPQLLPCLALSG